MKWIDYREKLGIGFNDEDKFNMLMNKIDLYIDRLSDFVGSYEIRCKNVFDESKIAEYDKLYEKEYKEAVEERIYRDIKQPYEWTVEGRFEQKEEIFLICELDEGYNGD